MRKTQVEEISVRDLAHRLHAAEGPLLRGIEELKHRGAFGLLVEGERPGNSLVVYVPNADRVLLLALAAQFPFEYNYPSADLRSSKTFLRWTLPLSDLEVRVAAPPNLFSPTSHLVAMAFLGSDNTAVVAEHLMDWEELEIVMAGLQSCGQYSGENWKPWLHYTDEEMAAAAGRKDEYPANILVPPVYIIG